MKSAEEAKVQALSWFANMLEDSLVVFPDGNMDKRIELTS
jgi:hypothetical protein